MFDPDKFFFDQLDPYYHYKQACLIYHCEQPNHCRIENNIDGEITYEEVNWPFENLESTKASSLRFIRYHQVETLLTVLFGSPPHGPVILVSRDPKIKMFDLARNIVENKIHEKFKLNKNGSKVIEFDQWIKLKLLGYDEVDEDISFEEILKFIQNECRLLTKNDSYVAFKHGCMVGKDSPRFEIKSNTGDWINLFNIKNPVAWVNCEFKAGKVVAVTMGAEELDPENDLKIIFLCGLIVEALKARSLAVLEDRKEWNARLPHSLQIASQIPASYKMRIA